MTMYSHEPLPLFEQAKADKNIAAEEGGHATRARIPATPTRARARRSDPSTSKEAARRVERRGTASDHRSAIIDILTREDRGMTAGRISVSRRGGNFR
jgi:hypothetical protein